MHQPQCSPSQLSRSIRDTHPRSCSLHPATHSRPASSATHSISGRHSICAGERLHLLLNLVLVSW